MSFYENHPARKRMIQAPATETPQMAKHDDPPQPVDASDGGSDTGEKPWYKAWTRQHAGIEIDQQKDGISDNGQEVWNFLMQKGIKNVIIMGVHTNMCVLNRPFAIKAMVRRGMNVLLGAGSDRRHVQPGAAALRQPRRGHPAGHRVHREVLVPDHRKRGLAQERLLTLAGKGKATMAGKGRQTARKPATKFAHLRKKMEKTRIVSKIGKKKK